MFSRQRKKSAEMEKVGGGSARKGSNFSNGMIKDRKENQATRIKGRTVFRLRWTSMKIGENAWSFAWSKQVDVCYQFAN